MHPFVDEEEKEDRPGWIFLSELPSWWQSMSCWFLLFCKEQPEQIQFILRDLDNDDYEIIAADKVREGLYKYKDVEFKLRPYKDSSNERNGMSAQDATDNPFYVGNHNFPKDLEACWCVNVSSRELDYFYTKHGKILTGFTFDTL